jgi:hypothetical protein
MESRLDAKGVLAIDFDDVLFHMLKGFVSFCSKYDLAHGSLEDLDDIAFTKIFNCDADQCAILFEKFVSSQECIDLHNTPPPDLDICVEKLKAIQDAGYRLVVVSAREHRFRHFTLHYLDTYFPGIFDTVCLCNYYGKVDEKNPRLTKFDVCYSLGCFALIDDNPKYIKEIEEKGMKGIPFGNYSWTVRHRELVNTKHIISSWKELTVDKINQIFEEKFP